jgi:choice-of-anchor B domain-containing protein
MGLPATLAALALALVPLPAVATPEVPRHSSPCIDGMAEGHACHNIDLLSHLDLVALGTTSSGNANDMWGWTDPDSGKEYALVGLDNGTAFIDISDPEHPLRLGNLPTHSVNSLWRDIKVYGHYAYVVSEAADHGMQVFDLEHLRNVANPPVVFSEDAWYGTFGRAHNIVIDEQSGFAYAVGSRQGTQQCNAGLHMIDIHDPLNPVFAGCFSADGYTHDAQCIVYDGPDADYTGHEVCFAANEDTLTIVDVTDKQAPVQLARIGYAGFGYTHQGWLTEDRRHLLLDDELDEINNGGATRTYVWDVQDLDQPVLEFTYNGQTGSSDHNLYIVGGYAYESDYNSGLRILDLSDIDGGSLSEAAFFDTYPANDSPGFDGTWSNYPWYASGFVGVSDITSGFYLLQPNLCRAPEPATAITALPNGDHRIDLAWQASATPGATYAVDRTLGGCGGGATETIASGLVLPQFSDLSASGQVTYGYRVRAVAESGQCAAAASACVEAQTTGSCTAPPAFAGIGTAASAGTTSCAIQLDWPAAQSSCGNPSEFRVYRSTDAGFTPAQENLLAGGIDALGWVDATTAPATDYTYIVHAADSGNGSEEANTIRLTARAAGPLADGDWFSGAEVGEPILGAFISGTDPGPRHVAWEIVDGVAHSGTRSYWSGYNNQECLHIDTPPITLTKDASPTLAFWTRYGIESGWDGGLVQVSSDDGATWETLTPAGGYPGVIDNGGANNNACDFPEGTGVFTGTDLDWSEQQFDLSSHVGQTVTVRWVFGTDTAQTAQGWWIDDVTLTHAQVPGQCTAPIDEVFADGFE